MVAIGSLCAPSGRAGRGLRRHLREGGRLTSAAGKAEPKRGLPPARFEHWLRSEEAILELGGARCDELLYDLQLRRERVAAIVPGAAWLEAWDRSGEMLPVPDQNRRHQVRMVLSRARVQLGEGPATRRWTPPQAVALEDHLDGMGEAEAVWYEWPESPSAAAIRRIGEMKAVQV